MDNDFSTYDRIVKRGKATIVCHNDEYRMIIGSLKNPKISLLIGVSPEGAANHLNYLLKKGDNEDRLPKASPVHLGGIRFSLTVSGSSSNRVFDLQGMDDPVRVRLNAQDLKAMIQACLDSR